MLADCKRPIWIVCLSLSVFFFTFGCRLSNIGDDNISLEPVRRLRIRTNEGQREQLFEQFEKFAEKHNFEIRITDYGGRGEHFQVWISGDSIQIISEDVPGDSSLFGVDFYGKHPGYPVDEKTVDGLLNDLKEFISEIPGVTITEQK